MIFINHSHLNIKYSNYKLLNWELQTKILSYESYTCLLIILLQLQGCCLTGARYPGVPKKMLWVS